MSGGFFRGTSADQDTRFSNKQAKLMKSQKFPPELEHLVDMTKVEMNVIRPWIATRVTELLGFEDEVLINFIYGLLDGKEVNGKEVQISLTGFMEKNTGKFMKELWTLLLSAQKNASGVPQQLLDAKGEEIKKKQAEQDRIANEIQKKKEKEFRELEQERLRKMDDGVESKATNADLEPTSKHMLPKSSSAHSKDEKETGERNGVRGRNRVSRSPHPVDRSPSSPRGSRSRSISKSLSNSRSYSKHRSASRSPEARGRSISSRRWSASPRRRHSSPVSLSPPRRKAFYSRRRSRSRSPRRSPSPMRRRPRSPFRRGSPSPAFRRRSPSPIRRRRSPSPIRRRRSPSPVRRRSPLPVRRRSPSPVRRRSPSPVRRRSPSPLRRKSPLPLRRRSPLPVRRRSPLPLRRRSPSPVRRRSPPAQRRSPSPMRRRHQRSPSTPRRRSPSPMRHRSPIPGRRRLPTPSLHRSPSAYESSSPSRSPSPVGRKSIKDHKRSPVRSPRERIRPSISLRSPQRDPQVQKDIHNKEPVLSPSPEKSPILEESPARTRKRSAIEDRRSLSPYEILAKQTRERMTRDGGSSPPRKPREQKPRHVSPEISKEEENDRAREDVDHKSKSSQKGSLLSSTVNKQKDSAMKVHYREDDSPDRLAGRRSSDSRNRLDNVESRKKDKETKSEKNSGRGHHETPDRQRSPTVIGDRQRTSYSGEGQKSDERNRSRPNNVRESEGHHKSETVPMSVEKVEPNNRSGTIDSGSEESGKHRSEGREKRKHKRSERREVASDDDYSHDSEIEERKEAKRRRKEEKKLRKEEKRWRREERRRKREERRAEKLKVKNQYDASASDGKESHPSDDEVAESDQKKLEIELRKKALESLKAKKGISH